MADSENIKSTVTSENILTIIHLDDSFIQSRINNISHLIQDEPIVLNELLKQTSYFEKLQNPGNSKVILEGMTELIQLILKIKSRISSYIIQDPNAKIFLLNFLNTPNAKNIYQPYQDKIIEIENSGFALEKNLEQTKSFLKKLNSLSIPPEKKIKIEIIGVYRYACVNNINSHLTNIIKEKNLPIENWINYNLTK